MDGRIFYEDDIIYIGRTKEYYDDNDDYLFTPDFWVCSEDPNDKDFAGEVYMLDDEGKRRLDWWLRCRRMNEYQRNHAFNPDLSSKEEIWEDLTSTHGTLIKW